MREYYAYPQQFLSFIDNQNYLTLIRASKVGNPAQLQQIMERARGNTTLQYLLNDKGALYLYRNKNVMVSAYCNIVIKPHGIFQPGMMWTYQSMTAPDIKLIKLYVPVRRAMPGILGTLKGTPPPQPLR